MLFGKDRKILQATNDDWSYILMLIDCQNGKWHVDEHVHMETWSIKWGTEEECREFFNDIVNNKGLTINT